MPPQPAPLSSLLRLPRLLQGGELAYLADWAASCAAVGLRLPDPPLVTICSYVQQHPQQLDAASRASLQAAFEAWAHQPGLQLLLAPPAAAVA